MKPSTALAVGLALAGALSAAPAQAQNRAFVSAGGSDSNACSFTAPCRSLQHAHDTVLANGEIEVLDPAGYGTLMINRATSIYGHGYTHISVGSGGTGITINANTTDKITLSGLIIDGQGVGQTGIRFNTGASLTIENCIIRYMVSDGVDFFSSTATSVLTVSNSLANNNGGVGIYFAPDGLSTATLSHIEANNNITGISVSGSGSAVANTVNATVSESVAAGNKNFGISALTVAGQAPTKLMIYHSVAANNNQGILSQGGAILRLANSTLTGNLTSWGTFTSGVVDSYGDNNIDGNGDGDPTPTKIPPK